MYPSFTPATEGMHKGEFLVSEAQGWRSRGEGTLVSGQSAVTPAGTVLGLLDTAADDVETVTISGSPTGGTWTYTVNGDTATLAYNATTAAVKAAIEALDSVGSGNVTVTGTAGSSYVITYVNELADTPETGTVSGAGLTGGSSPNATLAHTTPGVGTNRYSALDLDASDGSQTAVALLWETTDATDNDRRIAVILRDAEVNGAEITYPADVTVDQITTINTALASVGIVVRAAV